MVLTYFLNDFEMVPVAQVITGITLVFTFHIRCISIVRLLLLLLNIFLSFCVFLGVPSDLCDMKHINMCEQSEKFLSVIAH
jgi:hypothetical protein